MREYNVPPFTQPFEGSRLYKECAAPSLSAAIDVVATPEQRAAMPKAELSEMLMALASRVAIATHRQPPLPEEMEAVGRLPPDMKTAETIAVLAAEASPDDAFVAYRLVHIRGQDPFEYVAGVDAALIPQYFDNTELLAAPICRYLREHQCDVLSQNMKIFSQTKSVGAWIEQLLGIDEYSVTALSLAQLVLAACRRRQLMLGQQRIAELNAKKAASRDDRTKATLDTTILLEKEKIAANRPTVTINGAPFNALQILARLFQVRELRRLHFGAAIPVSLFPTRAVAARELEADSATGYRQDLRKIVTEFTHHEALHLPRPRRTTDGRVELGPPTTLTERSGICELLESGGDNHLWMWLTANLTATNAFDAAGDYQSVIVRGESVTPITCVAKACGFDPTSAEQWSVLMQLMRGKFAKEHGLSEDAAERDPRCELSTVTVNGVALMARTVLYLSQHPAKNPRDFQTFLKGVKSSQDKYEAGVTQKARFRSAKRIALFTAGAAIVGAVAVMATKLLKR